jgi:putative membrane protein
MISIKDDNKSNKLHLVLLALCIAATIISLIKPKSYLIWGLEAFPVIIGVVILIVTKKKFQFTNLVYLLILIVSMIMLVGAHYTYERVPLFNWIKEVYGLKRNNYDRVGHLLQGFVAAFVVRELLLRKLMLKKGKLTAALVVCVCLALSSVYELIEWVVALIGGGPTRDFLGAQGDRWDSHWDMFLALLGSTIMVTLFYKVHDNYIRNLDRNMN